MTQLEIVECGRPGVITVCGVECRQVSDRIYEGAICHLTIEVRTTPWGATVRLRRDHEELAFGSGESLAAAEQAMEQALRWRIVVLADASLTMATRGAL